MPEIIVDFHSPPPSKLELDTDVDKDRDTDSDSTSTCSDEEPDWNDDRDSDKTETRAAKRGRRLYLLFMKLARPIRTVIWGVLGSTILITPYIIFELRFHDSHARKQVTAWSLWFAISWGFGCVTSLVVDLVPRLTTALILAVYGKPPEQLTTYLELFMAVCPWLKLALNFSWTWVVLGLIRDIVNPPGNYWVYVNITVQAFFSAGLVILAEKLFLHFVAITFHKKALADRLHENHLGLHALDKLYNVHSTVRHRKAKEHLMKVSSRQASLDVSGFHGSSLSVTTSPLQLSSGANTPDEKRHSRHGSDAGDGGKKRAQFMEALGEAIGQIALKDSKYYKHNRLGSVYSARRLANNLFEDLSYVSPPRDYLIVEDFHPYFRSTSDATTAFKLFDQDNSGTITRKEMRQAVQKIYRERKALTAGLKDISSAVAKLDGVLLAVALIIIGFVCLLLFSRHDTVESLVPLATIVLGFSFIFGNSAMMLFDSMIFIFSTHPFDVGDLVIIDDAPLVVKEFGLFSTVFRQIDGQELIAPNSVLANSKLIHNVRRSNSMWEYTTLTVGFDTPLEMLEQMKRKLRAYTAANSHHWGNPGCEVHIEEMRNQNTIEITIGMEHRANWQDWNSRWTRRNAFMRQLKSILEELEIGYSLPPQPIYLHPSSTVPSWMTNRDDVQQAQDFGHARPIRGRSFSVRSRANF